MRQILVFVLLSLVPVTARAGTELANSKEIRTALGLEKPAFQLKDLSQIKVAVLDVGFQGFRPGDGNLPASAVLVERYEEAFLNRFALGKPDEGNGLQGTAHGKYLAQIVWAISGKRAEGPKFYLLNANGMTNLRRAVRYAIEENVDVILYAQLWKFGGNFDGKGFINAVVNEATAKGILWVNAAGNYGGQVYNGAIQADDTGRIALPGAGNCVRFENRYDGNSAEIALSWNDFSDIEDYQTTKDLGLELYKVSGGSETLVGSADRAQAKVSGLESRPASLHAREVLSANLDRGDYCVRVVARTKNFTSADRLRITLSSENKPADGFTLKDKGQAGEVMVPADNASVVTVGEEAAFSSRGPTRDGRAKPELILPSSQVRFTDGLNSSGTSEAAAIVAGAAVLMRAQDAKLNSSQLVAALPVAKLDFSQVPLLIRQAMAAVGATAAKFTSLETDQGRLVLHVKMDPLNMGRLFSSARDLVISRGMSSRQLRYFIALDKAGTNVETYFLGLDAELNLTDDKQADGSFRWVELKRD